MAFESTQSRSFRKKPVLIEAIQWTGYNYTEAEIFMDIELGKGRFDDNYCIIETKEGPMKASPGDWIIKEPFPTNDRRFYPCKPDIFEATYEEVEALDESVG